VEGLESYDGYQVVVLWRGDHLSGIHLSLLGGLGFTVDAGFSMNVWAPFCLGDSRLSVILFSKTLYFSCHDFGR
jgi:hypothetical protein